MDKLISDTNTNPVLNYRLATDEEHELISLAHDEDFRSESFKDAKIVIELGCGFKFIQVLSFFYTNGEKSKEGLVAFNAFGYLMENDNSAIYSIEQDIDLLNINLAENIIDSEIFNCVYMKP